MKKLFLATAIICTACLMTSCNSAGGDPKATLISFFEALGKKDIAGARKLATADSKSMLDMMEMGMKSASAKDNSEMDKFDKTKMEFGEAKIEGDKATVPVKEKTSGESTNFILKKESGSWKVAFDKGSMMQMGMDKMKEKGMDVNDMKKGMEEMNNVNMDSLKAAMENMNMDSMKDAMKKGMEGLDSAKKLMEKMEKH